METLNLKLYYQMIHQESGISCQVTILIRYIPFGHIRAFTGPFTGLLSCPGPQCEHLLPYDEHTWFCYKVWIQSICHVSQYIRLLLSLDNTLSCTYMTEDPGPEARWFLSFPSCIIPGSWEWHHQGLPWKDSFCILLLGHRSWKTWQQVTVKVICADMFQRRPDSTQFLSFSLILCSQSFFFDLEHHESNFYHSNYMSCFHRTLCRSQFCLMTDCVFRSELTGGLIVVHYNSCFIAKISVLLQEIHISFRVWCGNCSQLNP